MLSKIYLSRKLFLLSFLFSISTFSKAQTLASSPGKIVNYSVNQFNTSVSRATKTNNLVSKMSMQFPTSTGELTTFVFDETLIAEQKIANIQTFDAVSDDGKIKLKLTVVGNSMEGIIHTSEGYFFIEAIDAKSDLYRIYGIHELPKNAAALSCGVRDEDLSPKSKNGRILSISPFPVGTTLRKFKLAAAATGEMTSLYGSQANALAKIVSITNATNLIYELEASIRFELVTQTTNLSIIYSNPATDPFSTMDPDICQASFTSLNTSGVLPYTAYGIGHTFNALPALVDGYSANGVAGPTPCIDASKSRGFSQWTMDAPVAMIVGIFAHEVGHQFSAPHTYNAIGGTAGSPSFCLNGWSSTSAIEPGGGTTMMSYGDNCENPTNYTLSGNNSLSYFNTKSLEFIYTAVNGSSGTCLTAVSTGNSAPVANAGVDITIPKGTPFSLNGSATDANGDPMSYTWEQYDLATTNDKGALGTSINGIGGYSAVNSTTAPLFRSEQSSSSTSRSFPKLVYILSNANNPADNEGEDLPQVARTMKFRFTVRDNKTGGGGVDSDETIVTVNSSGPFAITAPNGGETWASSSSQTVTWSVNSTNTLAPNIDILLSIDGGFSFPYLLATNTPNDGSQSVTLPTIPVTTQARIKIVANLNANATFFDISNANFTITSTCNAYLSYICPSTDLIATQGSGTLNLGLTAAGKASSPIVSKTLTISASNIRPIVGYTDGTLTTCTVLSTGYYTSIFAFKVSKSGTYTLTNSTGGFLVMSVHNVNSPLSCSNFLGGNSFDSDGLVGYETSMKVSLNECTTYYLFICNFSTSGTFSVGLSGPGDVYETQTTPSGISYTYAAINTADNLVKAVNSTGNFTSLATGNYIVNGISYDNALNPTTFIGQSLANLMGGSNCLYPSSNNRKINVTCSSLPTAPTGVPGNRCGTGTVSLSATSCAGTYNWYLASTGGASQGSLAAFTTPSISTTTTYYVDCNVGGCVSATRTPVVATVNNIPSTPTIAGGGTCLTAPVTLNASGCGGTYNWYNVASGGSIINTGASFTNISIAGTYFVDCTVGLCTGNRSSATITIKPAAPTVPGVTIASGQTATLNATNCSGTVNWYATNISNPPLSSGPIFTSQALIANTTYYSDCVVGLCTSNSRTASLVTVTNCSSSLVLASTADDISTGDILKQASATASIPAPNANIMATNKITGTGTKATYQAKSILLNPGFSAATGTIFNAEPGGCN
jgi:Ig-like domain CHU_C associated/Metallo-peptidase family M12B Reprolysin-like